MKNSLIVFYNILMIANIFRRRFLGNGAHLHHQICCTKLVSCLLLVLPTINLSNDKFPYLDILMPTVIDNKY